MKYPQVFQDIKRRSDLCYNLTYKEIRLNNDYYLAHQVEAKKFNIKKPVVHNIPLEKDIEYILSRNPFGISALSHVVCGKFNSFDVSNNQIVAKFQIKGGVDSFLLPLGDAYKISPIIDKKQCRPLPSIFRLGRKIYKLMLQI